MNKFNLYLGKWIGVPVTIHWSLILVLLVVLFISKTAAMVFLGIFAIVLLHEFGHVFAAKIYGYKAFDVTLYPFGGVASLKMPSKPAHEMIVAFAGPAVNLVLMPIFWAIQDTSLAIDGIATANLSLLVFNLIPALPMDGGRIFRAALSWKTGDHLGSTETAVKVSKIYSIIFVIASIYFLNPVLLFIAYFVYANSQVELEMEVRKAQEQELEAESDKIGSLIQRLRNQDRE